LGIVFGKKEIKCLLKKLSYRYGEQKMSIRFSKYAASMGLGKSAGKDETLLLMLRLISLLIIKFPPEFL